MVCFGEITLNKTRAGEQWRTILGEKCAIASILIIIVLWLMLLGWQAEDDVVKANAVIQFYCYGALNSGHCSIAEYSIILQTGEKSSEISI